MLLAGDAVLQYRFSNEVIESIRDHGITYVVGNHELTLLSQDGERARSAPAVRRRATWTSWRRPRPGTRPGFPASGC